MDKPTFLLGDADAVRRKLELHLLNGDLKALSSFSANLSAGIHQLALKLTETLGAEVVFAGGDELLLTLEGPYNRELLWSRMQDFRDRTGMTISFGVGETLEQTFVNLARAKAQRPGSIWDASTPRDSMIPE